MKALHNNTIHNKCDNVMKMLIAYKESF